MLSVHIAIQRESPGMAASVHRFSLSDWHAVAHKHFGNNNLPYKQTKKQHFKKNKSQLR